MVGRGGTTQRLGSVLVGAALALVVSGCARASPSLTESSGPSALPGPTTTPDGTAIGGMIEARYDHTATLLSDGTVLVVGGFDLNGYLASAEVYDPSSRSWTAAGNMIEARTEHTATLLPDGQVLVAGGYGTNGYLASAELYDPITRSWTTTGNMMEARYDHTATLLTDGTVLVAGGSSGGAADLVAFASAELYDHITRSWTTTGNMDSAHNRHSATLLRNGEVLVAGTGEGDIVGELYDPTSRSWTATGKLAGMHLDHTATLLSDGRVLVAGGCCDEVEATQGLASTDLYDPQDGSWATTGSMERGRYGYTATLLPGGQVLVAGGYGSNGSLVSAELYDPITRSWTSTASLIEDRGGHTATLLADGSVLVTGGLGTSSSPLASAELYDPQSESWATSQSMDTSPSP